jgi:two-component system sensor histidine kinase KdpD
VSEEPSRPDPDRLLAEVVREEARAKRGRLRTFFGASAGVGKTYAMLEAARAAKANGVDVVVGYVEPHGRVETERLLDGLERLPSLPVLYRGVVRHEFDLDAALRRRAAITLVDELAHSNLVDGHPTPRHAKRWQDIEEMLDAGLDVWTTVNVQHLESLNDVVAGITGVRQQETVPDRIFDDADEIELIDLPPDDLLDRLKAGKVYLPEQALSAVERFFRKPNLIALRELALRRTADRVDAAARQYSGREPISRPWLARDRFLIAVAPDDQAEHLVRFAKRFADALDAEWTVVSVETPAMLRLGEAERNRRIDVLRLAESLGAETVTLDGPAPGPVILEYARVRNATRIVVGEPRRRGWREWLRPTTAAFLIRRRHGIDVTIVAKRDETAGGRSPRSVATAGGPGAEGAEIRWDRYGWALGISAVASLVGALMDPFFSLTNVVMVYLLGALVAGLRLGRGPAALTAVLNIVCFNFFFVPPRLTFAVSDAQYLVTFAVMLAVALTIATLAANVRQQTRVAGARERRTAMLYAMSRELAAARGLAAMRELALKHVSETFASRVAVLVPDSGGRLEPHAAGSDPRVYEAPDLSIAQWVYDKGQPAGLGTGTLPGAPALYLPLVGTRRPMGVLVVLPSNRRRVLLPEQRHLLETFAGQIALAIERAQLAEAAEAARVTAETETLRNTLLASISHDIRAPLSVIAGASSALADPGLQLDEATRARLARSIDAKARDVSELVSNVLDLMRFESGRIPLRRDWETVDDLVGVALSRLDGKLQEHVVEIALPEDLPPINVDAGLITQVLSNLLDNAVRHTPRGTRVTITGRVRDGSLEVAVEDDGVGLPPGDPERLFAKFQRGREEGEGGGAGLGLAICRAIITAHGGEIHASSRPQGGARFAFTLPVGETDA